jgi:Zn finger protein HypA/HybF involved in hydrogenase expression
MAKLIIEMVGRQLYTCGACNYRSATHIGKSCPQCHATFTKISVISGGEELENCYEPGDFEDDVE